MRLPEVPVIVTLIVPTVAPLEAASVRVLSPVVGFGLNDDETPLGIGEVTARPTFPLKPFDGWTVIIAVAEGPP